MDLNYVELQKNLIEASGRHYGGNINSTYHFSAGKKVEEKWLASEWFDEI